MAVYKVIQDVEAEDKLLGPLTLKSFIYAGIAAFCGFINFQLISNVHSPIVWIFVLMFTGPMALFGVLASPLGREQPTEVWLLSKIRFMIKPRLRIWDQDGQLDLVTVTAPKRIELHLTKDLNQNEVQSRLKTLASTLDTRGWAIKNVDVNVSTPETAKSAVQASDRLVGKPDARQPEPITDVRAADDIMDEKNNPTAQKFEAMMKEAEAERRHGLLSKLRGMSADERREADHTDDSRHKKSKKGDRKSAPQPRSTKDLPAVKHALKTIKKETAAEKARREAEEKAQLDARLAKARSRFNTEFSDGHAHADPRHHVVGAHLPPRPEAAPTPAPMTTVSQAVNMELAQSGSAFSVATLSGLANRQPQVQQTGPDEVTISLH